MPRNQQSFAFDDLVRLGVILGAVAILMPACSHPFEQAGKPVLPIAPHAAAAAVPELSWGTPTLDRFGTYQVPVIVAGAPAEDPYNIELGFNVECHNCRVTSPTAVPYVGALAPGNLGPGVIACFRNTSTASDTVDGGYYAQDHAPLKLPASGTFCVLGIRPLGPGPAWATLAGCGLGAEPPYIVHPYFVGIYDAEPPEQYGLRFGARSTITIGGDSRAAPVADTLSTFLR